MLGVKKQHFLPSGVLDPLTRLLGSLYKSCLPWFPQVQLGGLHSKPHRSQEPLEARGSRNLYITTSEIQESAYGITLIHTFILWITETLTFTSSIFIKLTE